MTTHPTNSNFYQGIEIRQFTATMVIPLTKTIFNWLPPATKVPTWIRSLTFRAALKRAYTSFAGYYPQWSASLFDEHFLNHGASSLLKGYVRDGSLPQASELALAWESQLGPASTLVRERRLAELTPVAADFLDWLTLELAISPFS